VLRHHHPFSHVQRSILAIEEGDPSGKRRFAIDLVFCVPHNTTVCRQTEKNDQQQALTTLGSAVICKSLPVPLVRAGQLAR
jgi:hypothetical protein